MDPEFDDVWFGDFDHAAHVERAIELAREAGDRGDQPFGSVLVRDDAVVAEARNAENTMDDLAEHPELTLARRAAAEGDDALASHPTSDLVMYTSTEPCAMCAGGIYNAGLRAVVYSVSAERVGELAGGGDFAVPCSDVFAYGGEEVAVVGDVCREAGEKVHREFW